MGEGFVNKTGVDSSAFPRYVISENTIGIYCGSTQTDHPDDDDDDDDDSPIFVLLASHDLSQSIHIYEEDCLSVSVLLFLYEHI